MYDAVDILLFLVTLSIIIFVVVVGYFYSIHRKYDHIPGPPRDSFWSGHVRSVEKTVKAGGVMDDYLLQLSYKYGNTFRISLWNRTFVMVTNADGVKNVIVTGNHPKSKMMYTQLASVLGSRFIGRCLDTETDSKLWVKRRQILDHWFKPMHQRGMVHSCNASADLLMSVLDKFADGKTEVKLGDYFQKVAIDLLLKVAYGVDIDIFSEKAHPFANAIFTSFTGFAKKLENPMFFLNPKEWKFCLDVWSHCKKMRKFGSDLFIERNEAEARGDYIPDDLVTNILKLKKLIPDLPDEITEDEFVNFIVAGHETTGLLLSYLCFVLAQNPDVYKRLQAEVDEVVGSKAVVTIEDLNACEYLEMVIKETLRLYPPVPHTFRQTMRPCEINGHRIPKGTELWVSWYVTGRHADNIQNPEKFDPERFRPGKKNNINRYVYAPFSCGPRVCIGKAFALNEAKTVIVKKIQKFDFSLVPGQPMGLIELVSLRPKGGATCYLRRREMK